MPQSFDASSRILYGNTLPAVCDANVGDVFFLTADTGDGRGVYICIAANTWQHLGWGGVGPSLPPGGTDGDVFVVNSGPNIGIYQYFSATWNLYSTSGGPTVTPGPVTYNDFTDTTMWIPVGSVDVTQSFVGNGLLLTGATARSANSGLSGVTGLFTIFPDPVNGNMELSITFDSYARVTDHLANDEWRYGCLWLPRAGRSNDDYCGMGYGGLSGGNQDFAALEEYGETLGGAGWVGASVFPGAPPAATTFTITLQSLRMVWSGNNDHGFANLNCTFDGGGGPLGGAIAQAGSYANAAQGLSGIRPFCGVWFNTTTNTGAARLVSFTVTQGQVVAPF